MVMQVSKDMRVCNVRIFVFGEKKEKKKRDPKISDYWQEVYL